MTTLEKNLALLDYCNIRTWWDKGYTGKLGLSVTHERVKTTLKPLEGMVTDMRTSGNADSHSYYTAMVHRTVLPERKIVCVDTSYSASYAEDGALSVTGPLVEVTIPWMLQYKPDVVYRSLAVDSKPADIPDYESVLDFCSFFTSAGNYSTSKYNEYMKLLYWYGVGAMELKNKTLKASTYTSVYDGVDFAGFGTVYVPSTSGKSVYKFTGTSAAAPWLAGMAGLINELFIDKTGAALPSSKMYELLKAYAGGASQDKKIGWGLPVLPDPDEIDVKEVLAA